MAERDPEQPQACVSCDGPLGMDTVSIAGVGLCCSSLCVDDAMDIAFHRGKRSAA
jgi:hypothetical protein